MSNREPDAALVERARLGSKEAFEELVLRYHRSVLAVTYRMTGDASSAEDAAQVAFLRAWTQLGSLRDAGAFRTWLYRLAVNASVDHLRRNRPAQPLHEEQAGPGPSPEGELLQHESAQAVREAVLRLPTRCRAALILREYEGLSYREIAQTLDVPIGTVMSRLHYARRLLRATLRPERIPPRRQAGKR